ncbi:hypothetical protein BN7_1228 [Wickerhamomyces ciferrii]|uniref:Protein transport protein n=1 Tax=Wickerhamomyces ciferrii (strain ATCC 14091 / BCRC 22168 / CBS 111 / JCM 3599 / NBRC 0793 / NRRL Y-1031 F-60-10) TaxID=1206466 RepID=K0KHN8_WICCF|nr:uncharacterized protein BN7_1228 [Wickerhamomyces ciferrii]CCH41687.1 hypothetical protein BN7_1228 [Wickerhamomyces ciferrii]
MVTGEIDQKRNNQFSIEAVYLLEPTPFIINCLLTDFTNIPTRYKGAHIFFLPGLTNDLSNKLKANIHFQKNLKTFQEFYLNIYPKESNAFTTKTLNSIQLYYNPQCHDLVTKTIVNTARSLVDLCVMTGEYPIIRYYSPNENDGYFNASVLPQMIATELQEQLDEYTRKHPDFPPTSTRQRSIFIITDRTIDLFAPLLHEFTYQAMAYDIKSKQIQNDVYHYEAEDETGQKDAKESKLDEKDPEWIQLRHLHIIDAQKLSSTRIEEFLSKNSMLVDRSKIQNTSDILHAVAHLKGFDEERRIISLHKILLESLLLENGERKLAELAEFEQNVVNFGVDIDGERVKNLADQLIENLAQDFYTFPEKLRTIVLYGLYRGGLIEEDYIKLFNFLGINQLHEITYNLELIKNFETIGFKLVKPNLKSKSIFKREFLHESISENSYNTSRFRPSMNSIITNVLSNTLDDIRFPYIKDKPIDLENDISRTNSTSTASLKNPKHKASWAKTNTQFKPPRQRIFYFIAGGATYSEIRTAYELSNKFEKDVIIGSDDLITPIQFIGEVKKLSLSRPDLKLYIDWKNSKPIEAPKYLLDNYSEKNPKTAHNSANSNIRQQQSVNNGKSNSNNASTQEPEKEKKRSKFKLFSKKSKD